MACTRVGVLLHAPVSRRTKRQNKKYKEKLRKRESGGIVSYVGGYFV
jgi:hypothetical protein